MKIIDTNNLNTGDLPSANASWKQIIQFASSFDVAKELPEGTRITSLSDVNYDNSIKEQRCALYIEWRRHNHFHEEPEASVLKQARSIIKWIHDKI